MPRTTQIAAKPRGKLCAATDPEYESRIQEAISGIVSQKYKTIAAAATANSVSRQTLSDRLNGKHQSIKSRSHSRHILSDTVEAILVDWARVEAASGTPYTIKEIQKKAFSLTGTVPRRQVVYDFLKRHRDRLKIHGANHLDPKHAQNFNANTVSKYFKLLSQVNNKYGPIPLEHQWNMDEKGIQMGGGRKGSDGTKYIFDAQSKDYYRQHSDNLELVTVLECGNAAGMMMKPYFVLKDGPLPNPLEDSRLWDASGIATSPTGWTDQEIFFHWFTAVFIPQANTLRENDAPIVLTLDGHNSHETDEIKSAAYDATIIIIAFPSKTTHKLQPLDVSVFGRLQKKWYVHADDCLVRGVRINRYNVIQEYCSVRDVMTPSLVQKAFEHTGIYPLNPNLFGKQDFAPSFASSTVARNHLPSSYPAEVLTSPIMAPTDIEDASLSTDDSDSDFEPRSDCGSEAEDDTAPFRVTEPIPGPSESESTFRVTRSSAPSLSWAVTLPPIPSYKSMARSSPDDLWMQLQFLYSQNKALLEIYQDQTRQLEAANAHCTIAERKVAHFAEKLANKGKKATSMKKVDGRFVTLPELRDDFLAEMAKKAKKEQADAQKKAEKRAEDDARTAQIAQGIKTNVFASLSTYKHRDDFVILAGALGLEQGGTVASLRERIKAYLDLDETRTALAHHPRFTSLFSGPSGSTRKPRARQAKATPPSYEANALAPPTDFKLDANSLLN